MKKDKLYIQNLLKKVAQVNFYPEEDEESSDSGLSAKETLIKKIRPSLEKFTSPKTGKTLEIFSLNDVDFSIKDDIKEFGFKWNKFKKNWTMYKDQAMQTRQAMEEYGIDTSVLDAPAVEQISEKEQQSKVKTTNFKLQYINKCATFTKVIESQKYGVLKFFVVYSPSLILNDDLEALGFKKDTFIKDLNVWTMPLKKAIDSMEILIQYGLDTSPLSADPLTQEEFAEKLQEVSHVKIEIEDIKDLPPEFILWRNELLQANNLNEEEREKKYNDVIKDLLGKLGEKAESPEVKKESERLIQMVLDAVSKFHNYSLHNSLLIALQKPNASYAAGATIWQNKMGRVPKPDATPIHILMPKVFKKTIDKASQKEISTWTPQEIAAGEKTGVAGFAWTVTYAYEDTIPIPGWKNRKGEGPFEPPDWKLGENEATPWLANLIEASFNWAIQDKNIKITIKDINGSAEGWARGSEITVNNKADGERLLTTLIHEIAHSLIHFDQKYRDDNKDLTQQQLKQQKEHEAESVAYIVCKHFHVESIMAPIYISGWGGDKAKLMKRLSVIGKAAKEIIYGINKHMKLLSDKKGYESVMQKQEKTPESESTDTFASNFKYLQKEYKTASDLLEENKPKPCSFAYEKDQDDDDMEFYI